MKTSQASKTLSWITTLYLNTKSVRIVRISKGPLFCFIVYFMKEGFKKGHSFCQILSRENSIFIVFCFV